MVSFVLFDDNCSQYWVRAFGVMLDHTILTLQITKSDITYAVSLVIAYGHFSLHQVFVWLCMTTGSILTLSSKRGMIKLSILLKHWIYNKTLFVHFGFTSNCYNATIYAVHKVYGMQVYVTITPCSYHISLIECTFWPIE